MRVIYIPRCLFDGVAYPGLELTPEDDTDRDTIRELKKRNAVSEKRCGSITVRVLAGDK
jgi:hypothetical protein